MKKIAALFVFVLTLSSCSKNFLLDGTQLSLYSWSGTMWRWTDSDLQEKSTKRLVYEEQYGEGNTIRLHQSLGITNGLAFCFNGGDECRIFDISSMERFESDPLPDKSHHNNAQFSHFLYDENDKFPLLFLSHGDYPPGKNDLNVIRIVESEKHFSYSVVKTIHNTIQEAQNCGSWVIDDEHDRLYLYCMTAGDWRIKENNYFCIFSFRLPDIYCSEDVTLGYQDVLNRWDYPYLIHQSGTYYNGYLMFNVQALKSIYGKNLECPKSVIAVNTANGHIDFYLPLDDLKETEGISVFDDKLYVSFKNGRENQLSFGTVFTLNEYTLPTSIIKSIDR